MTFEFGLRVYYEDTDAGGIVYYANYLKFMERARTEALIGVGLSQTGMRERLGLLFAVRAVAIDYLLPGRLEDELTVWTEVGTLGGARLEMQQEVRRGVEVLASARVTLACISLEGRPHRIPQEVRALLVAGEAA